MDIVDVHDPCDSSCDLDECEDSCWVRKAANTCFKLPERVLTLAFVDALPTDLPRGP